VRERARMIARRMTKDNGVLGIAKPKGCLTASDGLHLVVVPYEGCVLMREG
jgi:hypothetical protein